MKKILVFSVVFSVSVLAGASLLQGIAKEASNELEVLDSSAIELVDGDASQTAETEAAKASNKKKTAKKANGKADAQAEGKADAAETAEEKSYWVGATIGPIPEPILMHLPENAIPEGKGVYLADVLEKSPAEKAGLKRYDIVTKLDGQEVDSKSFAEKIQKSEGKKFSCEIFRMGKTQTLELTPEVRPANQPMGRRMPQIWGMNPNMPQGAPGMGQEMPEGFNPMEWGWDELRKAVPELPEMFGEDGEIRDGFPFPPEVLDMLKKHQRNFQDHARKMVPQMPPQPGMEMDEMDEMDGIPQILEMPRFGGNQSSQMRLEITPNTTIMTRTGTFTENGKTIHISVRKEGEAPAKILVEWDDESIETTEDNLEEIPEEIREKVKGFLNSGKISINGGTITHALPAPAGKAQNDDSEANGKSNPKAKESEKTEEEIQIQKKDVINLK